MSQIARQCAGRASSLSLPVRSRIPPRWWWAALAGLEPRFRSERPRNRRKIRQAAMARERRQKVVDWSSDRLLAAPQAFGMNGLTVLSRGPET
jgi:hypothetical protein